MRTAWLIAAAGFLVGIGYAGISAYWVTGQTALLDTVGGSIERAARSGGLALAVGIWAVVVVKTVAAVLPVLALSRRFSSMQHRILWALACVEAVILTAYGLVLTGAGLLIQAKVVHTGPGANRRALAWHAYLWDPWFLLWGVLVSAALVRARSRHVQLKRPLDESSDR